MTDLAVITALRLRERAARCRALAGEAVSEGIADELVAIAAEYEQDALRLERRTVTAHEAARFGLTQFELN